jgi:hypothetical protein
LGKLRGKLSSIWGALCKMRRLRIVRLLNSQYLSPIEKHEREQQP